MYPVSLCTSKKVFLCRCFFLALSRTRREKRACNRYYLLNRLTSRNIDIQMRKKIIEQIVFDECFCEISSMRSKKSAHPRELNFLLRISICRANWIFRAKRALLWRGWCIINNWIDKAASVFWHAEESSAITFTTHPSEGNLDGAAHYMQFHKSHKLSRRHT